MANRTFSIKLEGKGPINECGSEIAGMNVPMKPDGGNTYVNKQPVIRDVDNDVTIEIFLKAQTNTEWTVTVKDETAGKQLYTEDGYAGDTDPQEPLWSQRLVTKDLSPLN